MEPEVKFNKLEKTVEEIKVDIHEIKKALLGNVFSGEKGLTGRLNVIDARQELIDKEIKTLIQERVRNAIYVRIITWLLTVIGVGILGLFFDYLRK